MTAEPIMLKSHGLTDVGKLRDHNEDSYLIDDENSLFVVADGMGGAAAGEVASATVVEKIGQFMAAHTDERSLAVRSRKAKLVRKAINEASVWILDELAHGQPGESGSTVVVAVFDAAEPDAATLLDRMYTMRMSNLAVGMTRYALMVDEAGVIIDDGIAARYADQHFYFTTTTGGSDAVYREIQRRIAEWGLQVEVVNRTGQLAAMNLAGPMSRQLLAPLTDIDLDESSFPYLAVRRGKVLGCEVSLMRVGFVGELGYEIHLRSSEALQVWSGLLAAGEQYGIAPFGVEAQRLLRLEKGHIIVGQDSDGLTNPYEAGMGWAAHMKKDYFVGQRSLQILQPRLDKCLRGFVLPVGYDGDLPSECHLLIADGEIHGRVTSVSFSPSLQRVIGLAYVHDLGCAAGDSISIRLSDGRLLSATICELPFYDPDGLRQSPDSGTDDREVA